MTLRNQLRWLGGALLLVAGCSADAAVGSIAPGSPNPSDAGPGSDEGGTIDGSPDAGTPPPPSDGAGPTPHADAAPPGTPAFSGSSGGSGGAAPVNGDARKAGGIDYLLVVPASYAGASTPTTIYYTGSAGADFITHQFILNAMGQTGTDKFIFAVLDGRAYGQDGQAGATVLDDVRAHYNVDNDRTYLISQSAGTAGALTLGFHVRQGWFAAYYVNDVVGIGDAPAQTATQLGFAPWGQAGPGGNLPLAQEIATAMQTAGYRLPNPAPYAGPGATKHGSLEGQLDSMTFIVGKTR